MDPAGRAEAGRPVRPDEGGGLLLVQPGEIDGAAARDRRWSDCEARVPATHRDGAAGDDAERRTKRDVAEEMALDLDARGGDICSHSVGWRSNLPAEVALQH